MILLNAEGISKSYSEKILLDDFSLGINEGDKIGINIAPQDIHVMKKSEYSGKFGDYSSFSDEMDYISDPTYVAPEKLNEREGEWIVSPAEAEGGAETGE